MSSRLPLNYIIVRPRPTPRTAAFFPLKAAVSERMTFPHVSGTIRPVMARFFSRNDPLTCFTHVIPAYACVC